MTELTIRQLPDRTYEHVIEDRVNYFIPGTTIPNVFGENRLVTKIRFVSTKKHKNMSIFEINGVKVKIDNVNDIPLPPKKFKGKYTYDNDTIEIKLPKRLKRYHYDAHGNKFLLDMIKIKIGEDGKGAIAMGSQNISQMKRDFADNPFCL